ncbi:MAG: histidine phosphatase family protein [Actinomycetes bacterium]
MTVYLVRHAAAGVRNDADPYDDDRHLDADGILQAQQLCEWLQLEPITAIVSSPFPRCQETVLPLATARGLTVDIDARLGEGTDIERSWELLATIADDVRHRSGAGSPAAAVACSHGDVIPDLIRRAQSRGMLVPGKSGCAKGSVWMLQHWDGEGFGSGIYTPVRP